VDQSLEKDTAPLVNRAPNHIDGSERQETLVAVSRLKEIGEQAMVAVAASLSHGGPIIRSQLIASRFYEAVQRELKRLPMHDSKRAALIAVSDRCAPIADANINPSALLDELRNAIAVLEAEEHASPPPPSGRPILRLIEGGLSS
jgi:hypothetical protein